MFKKMLFPALLLLPLQVLAQNANTPPSITVSGQAEIMVIPDEVVFMLEVDNVDRDLEIARKATDADVKKVFALARKYQIPPQNVQTYYISVDERYAEKVDNKPREFRGYGVSQTIAVLLSDIARFESLFSELLTLGITEVRNVDFRVSAVRKYMDQARTRALRSAREKAIAMAGVLGQKIGKPYNITEVGMDVSSAYSSGSNQSTANNSSLAISDNVRDNETSVAPGMMSVTARVKVTFALY